MLVKAYSFDSFLLEENFHHFIRLGTHSTSPLWIKSYQNYSKTLCIKAPGKVFLSLFFPASSLHRCAYPMFVWRSLHSSSSSLCLVHISFELPTTSAPSVSASITLFWSFNMSLCFLSFVKPSSLSHLVFLVLSCLNPVPASSDGRVTLLEEMSACWLLTDGLFWAGWGGKHSEVMAVNVRSAAWLAHNGAGGSGGTDINSEACCQPAVSLLSACPHDHMSLMLHMSLRVITIWTSGEAVSLLL